MQPLHIPAPSGFPVMHLTSGDASMSLLLDEARFAIEYDERFAAQKALDDDRGTAPYGDTPNETLKSRNWRQWCGQAALSMRFCRLCDLPMDPIEDTHPDDRCSVCIAMESVLFHSTYWQNLPQVDYSHEDRNRMGLE